MIGPRGRTALATLLFVIVVGVAAIWPYHTLLDQLPWGADASRWVADGSLDNPHWWSWATDRKHFVGYRPVTALTFVLDHALFGYAPLGYRLTDLVLHVASGLLVGALWVSLTGDRSPAVFVPVLVLLGHPATEEVIPYVARRSYLLANDFGILAFLCLLRAMRSERRRSVLFAVSGALFLGVAVLANEVAYVFLPLFGCFALLSTASGADRRRALPRVVPFAIVCGAALVLRTAVLGTWTGGYAHRYFAIVQDGVPMWTETARWQPVRIARACWNYLLVPISPSGAPALVPEVLAPGAIAAFVALLALTGVVRPLRAPRSPDAVVPLLGSLWLVGATAIVVLSQTWFWRQAYTLLVPLGLLCGVSLVRASRALAERRPGGLVGIGATGFLLCSLVYSGPIVRGVDQVALENQRVGNAQALRVRDAIATLEGPATVWLVTPSPTTTAHLVRLWGDRFGASRKITFRLIGSLAPGASPGHADVSLVEEGGRQAMTLAGGLSLTSTLGGFPRQGPFPLDRLYRAGREDWLLALDERDTILVKVTPPPTGVPLAPPVRDLAEPLWDGPDP